MAAEQSRALLASAALHPQEIGQKRYGLKIFARIHCLIHETDPKSAGLGGHIQGLCDLRLDGFLITRFVPTLIEKHLTLFAEEIACRRRI